MRPIKLKISGLNSYIETQTIDFAKLTERGLFGIFGPTGCGKSTILDAIILSLYGHKGQKGIPRSTNEFINTATEQASISYVFGLDTEDGPRRVQVERKFKRTNTGLSTSYSRLQIMTEDEEVVDIWDKTTDVSNQVVELLGLTREDFMRSVVLPQGKFSEFLTLEGKERRDMLERLLNLKAYGSALQFKIKRRGDLVKDKMLQMEGEMKRYADVSPEVLEQAKLDLKQVQEEETEVVAKFVQIEKDKVEGERLFKLVNSLKENQTALGKLEEAVPKMEHEKKILSRAEKAIGIWPYFTQFNEANKTSTDLKKQLSEMDQSYNEASSLYKNKKEARENFLKTFDQEKEALVLKKSAIEKAKEHQVKAEELTQTRNKLLQTYKLLKLEQTKQVEETTLKEKEIKASEQKLIELDAKKTEYSVKAEERELVLKGLKQEEAYKKLVAQEELIVSSLKKKIEQLELEKKRLNQVDVNLKTIESDLELINEKLDQYQKHQHALPLQISKLENERVQKCSEHTALQDKLKVKSDLKDKQKTIESSLSVVDNKAKILNEQLKEAQQSLKKAEADRFAYWTETVLTHLSSTLENNSACPLCGSGSHPHVHEGTRVEDATNWTELESSYREVSIACEQIENEKKYLLSQLEEVKSKLADLLAISEATLLQLDKDIRGIDDHIKDASSELKTLEEHTKKATLSKREVEHKVDALRKQEQEYKTSITRLETQVASNTDQHESIKIEIVDLEDQLNFNENGYIFEKQYNAIKERDKNLATVEKELEGLRNESKANRDTLDVLKKSSHEKQVEMEKIVEKGSGLKERIESHKTEVQKVVGTENLVEVLKRIEAELERLLKENDLSKQALDTSELKYRELESQIESLKAKHVLAIANLEDSKNNLEDALKASGLETKEALQNAYMERTALESRKDALKDFEESLHVLHDRIKELEKERNKRDLSEEDYKLLIEAFNKTKTELDQVKETRAALMEKLKSLEKDMKQLEATMLRYKKYQNAGDLVKDLLDLVKGNKFVEYVAVTHLKYIALDASKRLMDITNHRYSLELDAKGNFIICDHYNGGVKRDTKTLSGGETFLTALSLSLALSSQIQLKGRTNLEFFFLDEGFGTLDSELLDIVMTSLEKLFHEKLTVGIISHVDELKNRVPIKLTVEPAQAGVHGTKTKIEVT